MSNFPLGARGRVPGPIGVEPSPIERRGHFDTDTSLFRDKPRAPEHAPSKGMHITGPYPRISMTEGYVAGKPGTRTFHTTSPCENFEAYGQFPKGHTHTDIYLAPTLPSGQSSFEAIIPSSVEGVNFEGRMRYRIPAGSKVFATTIPFKEKGYNASQYAAELDAIKQENPNAVLFVRVYNLKDPRVEVLGFDPSTASQARPPQEGREIAHLYSNSAYSSLQAGTLCPIRICQALIPGSDSDQCKCSDTKTIRHTPKSSLIASKSLSVKDWASRSLPGTRQTER